MVQKYIFDKMLNKVPKLPRVEIQCDKQRIKLKKERFYLYDQEKIVKISHLLLNIYTDTFDA